MTLRAVLTQEGHQVSHGLMQDAPEGSRVEVLVPALHLEQ